MGTPERRRPRARAGLGTIGRVLNRSRLSVLALTAAVGLALAGCGGPAATATPGNESSPDASAASPGATAATPTPTASATPSVKPVNNLDAITVAGAAGKAPQVTIKTPYAVDETRSKVLTPGNGPTVQEAGFIDVNYVGVNGRTGKVFDSSFKNGQSVSFPLDQVVPGFKKGLAGKKVGDRVLIAMPGADGYDASGGNAQAGINVGDTLVFVVDIVGTQLTGPSGTPVAPKAGLPTVADEDGKPVITVPKAAAPTALVAQPLVDGNQAHKLAAGDSIVVHYRSASWKTGKQLDDKYDAPTVGTLSSTIPCWQKGLVGKAVGSRVLLVCPPADGFPEGSNNPPIEKGDTVVYVVDLLFASKQQLA